MADFIGGYPAGITVNGNDIIFAKGDFDNIVFSKYEAGDYVANVSLDTPASQIITAVPGLQDDGTYKITIDDASGWTTGDRCTPQAQSAIYWHTAGNTAIANMAMDDRLLLWFYNTNNGRNHFWTSGTQAKAFSISGMASCLKVIGSRVLYTINMTGDFSSQTEVATIENVNFGVAAACIYAKDTSGSGAGFRVTRCSFNDQGLGVFIDTVLADATPGQVDNCLFMDCYYSLRGRYNKYYFNTIIGALYGFAYNTYCTIENCLVEANEFAYEATYTVSDTLTNALADDPVNNIIHFDKLSEIGLWADCVDWNFINARIVETSPAYQAGSAVTEALDDTNLYIDIDGNDNSNYSIGCHAGTATAYPTGDVTTPGKPTITSVTPSDESLSVSINADSESDSIYVRFRETGTTTWSVESGTYSRTGSGSVSISGLTNGKSYQIAAYAKDGYITSDWTTNCYAVPGIVRTIIDAAEDVKALVADLALSQSITPSRVYINSKRLENISNIEVWVQPIEQENTPFTRGKDKNSYTVDIGIFKRCVEDSEVDEMVTLANEIYRGLRGHTYSANQKTMNVETPTIFSPDFLEEKNMFAAVISVKLMDTTP